MTDNAQGKKQWIIEQAVLIEWTVYKRAYQID